MPYNHGKKVSYINGLQAVSKRFYINYVDTPLHIDYLHHI